MRVEFNLQCPKCKGTDISAEVKTWARFKRDVPSAFDDDDLPSVVLIDGERICHHCNHVWEETTV